MLLAALALAAPAEAAGSRVGIFVGSNAAPEGKEALAHAQADAARMRRVFIELGGLEPSQAYLLEGPSADQILQTVARAGADAQMLVFYYSGHADERALLLGESELDLTRLSAALEATEAQIGLHIVDACRSGAMTRRKGASLGEPFSFDAADRGEGKVVITSSAEWEDSHESDRLGGSFFTLHMATGLRGAADADENGRVTLSEAYRYVYDRTVESTLASGAGVQHPTFRYDLSGRGDLTLTWPTRAGGVVHFGAGDYVVVDARTGRVAAEVRAQARLALAPGAYRVHKRTSSEVLSGRLEVRAGSSLVADAALTEREAHARLVRKGGPRGPRFAHTVRVLGGVRGRVGSGLEAAPMFRIAYDLVLPWFTARPYLSATTPAGFETPRLRYLTRELGVGLLVFRALDFRYLTLRGGLLAEGLMLMQSEAEGREPGRTSAAAAVGAHVGLESPPLLGDFVAALSGEAALYAYRFTSAELEPAAGAELTTRPTYRVFVSLGYQF